MQETTTPKTTFDALPADARIWVFAAPKDLSADEQTAVSALMDKVLGKWVVKQSEIRGCFEIREDRFLVVGADESRIRMDGCSVDAMTSWIRRLEAEIGFKLIDRMTVHYRDAAGAIRSVSRAEFKALAQSGAVTTSTPVFDTTASRIETLRTDRFELPLGESWHAKLV